MKYAILFLSFFYISTISAQVERPIFRTGVEQMPQFPGCEESDKKCSDRKFTNYVMEQLPIFLESEEQPGGRAIVSFVINEKGEVEDIKIIKARDTKLEIAVTKVMESMTKNGIIWTPGRHDGKPVAVRIYKPFAICFD